MKPHVKLISASSESIAHNMINYVQMKSNKTNVYCSPSLAEGDIGNMIQVSVVASMCVY